MSLPKNVCYLLILLAFTERLASMSDYDFSDIQEVSDIQKKVTDIQKESSKKVMKILKTTPIDYRALEELLNQTAIAFKRLTIENIKFVVSSVSSPTGRQLTTSLKPEIYLETIRRTKHYKRPKSEQKSSSQMITTNTVSIAKTLDMSKKKIQEPVNSEP